MLIVFFVDKIFCYLFGNVWVFLNFWIFVVLENWVERIDVVCVKGDFIIYVK